MLCRNMGFVVLASCSRPLIRTLLLNVTNMFFIIVIIIQRNVCIFHTAFNTMYVMYLKQYACYKYSSTLSENFCKFQYYGPPDRSCKLYYRSCPPLWNAMVQPDISYTFIIQRIHYVSQEIFCVRVYYMTSWVRYENVSITPGKRSSLFDMCTHRYSCVFTVLSYVAK